jgi:hypothetical protein
MGVESGYQRVPFAGGNSGWLIRGMLHAQQHENLSQSASGSSKLTVPPPAGTGYVMSQCGFVCLSNLQSLLAQPAAKPIGHAHVPPNSFWWILFLAEDLGDKRQMRRQGSRLQSGKRRPLLE